jgi:hypothetical protein
MSDYVFLLTGDEAVGAAMSEQERKSALAAHQDFADEVARRGCQLKGGAALQPSRTARSVRFTDGRPAPATDGPFAELKEGIGGFYVIGCRDLEQALELASLLPMSTGTVEVRPVEDGTTSP